MYYDIGLAENFFDNDNYLKFINILSSYFKPISVDLFSSLIDVEEFNNNEGWYPCDICNQDPHVIFSSGKINDKDILIIKHSGYHQVFSFNGVKLTNDDLISTNPSFVDELDVLSWLLAPRNSILSIAQTGTEELIKEDGNFIILKSNKGIRYQLLNNKKEVVSAMQIVNNTIENIYTSKSLRKKSLSKKLINRALLDFPKLKHSNIQTDLGVLYSKNSKLKNN